jgi:hypothetical protein
MAILFPTSIDALSNPTATDPVTNPSHALQHSNVNDAIEALEAKVGINSSAVTSSHDYKLSEILTTDKAVGKSATQTLTNKTFTSPILNTATVGTKITIPNTGLHLQDTNASHDLVIAPGSDLTAERTLTITTGDASRILNLGADLVLSAPFTLPADPNADRIIFWDDSAGATAYLTAGTGLQIVGTTLSATGTIPTCVTSLPRTVGLGSLSTNGFSTNTTQALALFEVNNEIIVNKITIEVTAVGTTGTLDLVVYSESGQAQLINVTTASISGTGIVTTAVSAVTLSAGNYWIAVNPNSTADITIRTWSVGTNFRDVTSEPILVGTLAISAGTPASTFTPSAITGATHAPAVRLDN